MNLLYLVSIWAAIYVDVGDTKRGEKKPTWNGLSCIWKDLQSCTWGQKNIALLTATQLTGRLGTQQRTRILNKEEFENPTALHDFNSHTLFSI